jgi:N-acetylglucosamine kinase-like BadF-type ATPase
MSVVLAVDGGNSKTDLALVRDTGEVLALIRGPLSSPHHLGTDGSLGVLEGLLHDALAEAGLGDGRPVADIAELLLAGVDFPAEEEAFRTLVEQRRWAERVSVRNDTFAILRAGTERGWGIAITSGAGINCVGVAPDGRHARFPALGPISGDWGGGVDLGLGALAAAARSADGRGPRTVLEHEVPAHFGLSTPLEVTEAIHNGEIAKRRVAELAPLVFAEAADDPVAAGLVDRLASEVVAFARAALTRLGLDGQPVEVLLGGGLLQTGDRRLHAAIEDGLRAVAPAATVRAASSPPIVGAALLGLDALGAGDEAQARLRAELGAAVGSLRQPGEETAEPSRLNTSVERADG